MLIAYYILRVHYPRVPRPFRLPEWWKYLALVLALMYAIVWFYGGPVYALSKFSLAGQSTIVYYAIGLGTILTYMPLHWWRRWQDGRHGIEHDDLRVPAGHGVPGPVEG